MHCALFVEGVVQGVGFRAFAAQTALQMGLNGFVRNLPDGRVEVQCDCDEKTLEEFKRRISLKSTSFFGPNVEKITVEKLDGRKNFEGFEIAF
ncbi:TPA: acylphosphatase [Candidatus Micrarchaeota archaeon]|nr:acylphosphatase [Candidatus Micrarchaeota archaeon]